jgi:anti-sigma regulatory factor (Ser/Thr protein kinase)
MATPIYGVSLDGGDHVVQLYEHDSELVDAVAGHVAAGVAAEEVAIVIASDSEAHREAPAARKLVAEFAAERDSPRRARRLVLSALAEWGCDPALLRDAAVVASELATNSVLHAGSPFSISVALEESLLRIAVHDIKPLSVAVRGGGLSPQPTHGLGLVEALSLRWGAERTAQGKAVWAELRASNELQASR